MLAAPAIAKNVSRTSGELTRYPDQRIAGRTVPEGATARVQRVETGDGRTIVTLRVAGWDPQRRTARTSGRAATRTPRWAAVLLAGLRLLLVRLSDPATAVRHRRSA